MRVRPVKSAAVHAFREFVINATGLSYYPRTMLMIKLTRFWNLRKFQLTLFFSN
jgi:hypothetical protein